MGALIFMMVAFIPGCGGNGGSTGETEIVTTRMATTTPAVLTGEFTLMLVSSDPGGTAGNGSSGGISIAGGGAFVSFASAADNLVPGDSNGAYDIFRKDVATGAIIRVSISSTGAQADGDSGTSSTSGDGRYVAFWSEAGNLAASDTDGVMEVYVKDTLSGATALASADAAGAPGNAASDMPAIADDGRFIAFRSAASNLVPGDTNGVLDVFVRDTVTGTTALASTSSAGAPGDADSSDTYPPAISADGRYVAFESAASNLVPGDINGKRDIFVKDMETGETRLVSVTADGIQGDGGSLNATISDDGRFVLFRSIAGNLAPGDTRICNGVNCSDIFLKDLETGVLTKVSTDAAGSDADDASWDPALSGDGRYAAFSSAATNLAPGDANGDYDVFVKDIANGAVYLVSRGVDGQSGNDWSIGPYLSADGLRVAFRSEAADLAPGGGNGVAAIFLATG